MNPAKPTGRSIGLLYLVTMLPAPLDLIYLPSRFIVAGDAAATAHNIVTGELVYRLCVLSGFFSSIMFIFLGLRLYHFFRDVDRQQARLLVALVLVSVAVCVVNLLNEIAPLLLLRRAGSLSAFSTSQLEALAYGFLRLRGSGLGLASAFWGLWLLPFGILVIKSRVMPKLIGGLLIMGCVGYLIQSLASILLPQYVHTVFTATIPLVAPGEISVVIWFLTKGARARLSPIDVPGGATSWSAAPAPCPPLERVLD